MLITWHGLGCVRIQTKETTVLIDPPAPNAGLSTVRLSADLFLFTSEENPNLAKLDEAKDSVISYAGEYEFHGIMINGVAIRRGNTVATLYTLEAEGVTVGILGALGSAVTSEELNGLQNVDVLLVPVGGTPVLSPVQATELISQIEPRIVIPTYYATPGLKMKLEGADKFMKELGVTASETSDKFRISKKELPDDDMRVVILTP